MRLLVPVVACLAGLLFATSASTAQGTDLRAGRRLQLTELIAQERAEVDRQEALAAELREEVEGATARSARGVEDDDDAEALLQAAGLTPVEGPSVTVRMDDAPRGETPPDAVPDDLVVHQQDVQSVLNALWAGGAEAVTVMGERIISTSAVRCVGNTLLVQGRLVGPPFVVSAIGDPGAMRTALSLEPGVVLFRQYVRAYGLGYSVTNERELRMPAYDGPLELPHADTRSVA